MSEATTPSRAPVHCERCGRRLEIFEEHPDGGVIYSACDCPTPALKTYCMRCGKPKELFDELGNGEAIYLPCPCETMPAAPASEVRARLEREVRYCRHCHAPLVVVGTRPDFTPIEAVCPCQRPQARKKRRGASVKAELQRVSAGRVLLIAGAVVLVLGGVLAGFWYGVSH